MPVFLTGDLITVMGEENMIQELPEEYENVLEEQRKWNSRISK